MSDYLGIYQGSVLDSNDPEHRGRIKCLVPQVLGEAPSTWCEPMLPTIYSPPVGEIVWIQFIDGDNSRPIYQSRPVVTADVIAAGAITEEKLAFDIADGILQTFYAPTEPVGANVGDLWYNTTPGSESLWRYNGTIWQRILDADVAAAVALAGDAVSIADGKIVTFAQATPPIATAIGDVWVDTDDGNKLYRAESVGANEIADGEWVSIRDFGITTAQTAANDALSTAVAAQSTADGKNTVYYEAVAPTPPAGGFKVNDLWFNTSDGNRPHYWNGTAWVAQPFGNAAISNLDAGSISAGILNVAVELGINGQLVVRGAGGETVGMTGDQGFFVKGSDALGNPLYVSFPTDGRPNIISGTLQATTLTVEGDATSGQAATFRRNSQVEPGGTFTLNDSIVAPLGGPYLEPLANEVVTSALPGALAGASWDSASGKWYVAKKTSTGTSVYTITESVEGFDSVLVGSVGASYKAHSFTKIGTHYYFVVTRTSDDHNLLYDFSLSGSTFTLAATLDFGTQPQVVVGPDSSDTSVWVADWNGGNSGDVRFRRYAVSGLALQETVTTTFNPSVSARAPSDLFSVAVGDFDFGARKFVLTFNDAVDIDEADTDITYRVGVFTTSGAREAASDFPLMKQAETFMTWTGTSTSDATGRFVDFGSLYDGTGSYIHKYEGTNKLSASTETWYAGSTFYRSSDGAETTLSPQAQWGATVKSRWQWKATVAAPPGGLGSRVYVGKSFGYPNAKVQGEIPPGETVFVGNTYNNAGAAPPTSSTFGSTTPALVQSQALTSLNIGTVTTTNDSSTVTGTNLAQYMVGKKITATGIPADATVLAVASSTSMTISANATASGSVAATLTVPKLEIRGDGYARITELERVILSSTTDVNASAGNTPPLRIGNVSSNHMRLDGNEIQAMTDDSTVAALLLNAGGGAVSFGGKSVSQWFFGKTAITTNASGQDTIAHNCGGAPTMILSQVEGSSVWEAINSNYTSTTFTVTLRSRVDNSVAGSGVSPNISWIAFKT